MSANNDVSCACAIQSGFAADARNMHCAADERQFNACQSSLLYYTCVMRVPRIYTDTFFGHMCVAITRDKTFAIIERREAAHLVRHSVGLGVCVRMRTQLQCTWGGSAQPVGPRNRSRTLAAVQVYAVRHKLEMVRFCAVEKSLKFPRYYRFVD